MSELISLNLDRIVEDVEIVLSSLEAIAVIPSYEDIKSKPDDDFLGPEWIYQEIEYDQLWSEVVGPLERLRISLNEGDAVLIDCRQPVREILQELWKWLRRFQPKLEYRLGGLGTHDFDFGFCDDCSAAEPSILREARELSNRLCNAGKRAAKVSTGETETASPRRRRASKELVQQRQLVYQRWSEFRGKYKDLGYPKASYELFAQWAMQFENIPSDDHKELKKLVNTHTHWLKEHSLRGESFDEILESYFNSAED